MLIIFIAVCVLYSLVSNQWGTVICYALAILIHESGHLMAASLLGIRLRHTSVTPWGLRFEFDFYRTSMLKETVVSFAGSGIGMLSSLFVIHFAGTDEFFGDFAAISTALSLLNLLPVKSLDGGHILEAVLNRFFLPRVALIIYTTVSGGIAVIFWVISVWVQFRVGVNLSLLMLGVYFLFSTLIFT